MFGLKKLQVGLGDRSYPILIGSNLLRELGQHTAAIEMPKKLGLVTNSLVRGLYGDLAVASLTEAGFDVTVIEIPDGEQYKNLETLNLVITSLIEAGFDRSSGLVALGGGVVGDLAGFVASVYLRGIPFVQVPTTLLAQVDSAVGGKTAVNHGLGKNLIGAFYQPRMVLADVATLNTLAPREFRAGLAEVIKYGIIRDGEFFLWLEKHLEILLDLKAEQLVAAVEKSCQIKADIVEIDEKEGSLRAILNLGHTYGHAVENLAGYGAYKHGEAVAIGTVVAGQIACQRGLSTKEDQQRIVALLKRAGLPTRGPDLPLPDCLAAMGRDKKVSAGSLRMVLNEGIGNCRIEVIPDPETTFSQVLDTIPGEGA